MKRSTFSCSAASITPARPSPDGLRRQPPEAAIGYDTPAASTAQIAATDDPRREMERLCASAVATPARKRQTKRQAPVACG